MVASLDARYPLTGGRGAVVQKMKELAQGYRGSMRSRSEIRPVDDYRVKYQHPQQWNSPVGPSHYQQPKHWDPPAGPSHRRYNLDDTQWPMDQRICDHCGRRGHVRRKCYKLKNDQKGAVRHIDAQEATTSTNNLAERLDKLRTMDLDSDDSDSGDLECIHISYINKISDPCLLNVIIENNHVQMEIDSGSSVTVMDKNLFVSKFNLPLLKSSKQLIVINGSKLKVCVEVEVWVEFNEKKTRLNLLVLDCDYQFIPLLGRPWLDDFFPNWRDFFLVIKSQSRIFRKNQMQP